MEPKALAPGARVRVCSTSHKVELRADTGSVVRPDEWLDYYVVRLDVPALYRHPEGQTEELAEIVEDVDNLVELPEG